MTAQNSGLYLENRKRSGKVLGVLLYLSTLFSLSGGLKDDDDDGDDDDDDDDGVRIVQQLIVR